MITLTPKRQLGVRVRSDTADELKRIAAAREMSVNELTEQILLGHLAAISRGETMNLDEFTAKVDELIAEHTVKVERLVRDAIQQLTTRVLGSIDALKAMIDSHVKTCHPELYDKYVDQVKALMRQFVIPASKTPIQ